ncbi:MAG: cysteine--tRNA ligase [Deltaproteobacteria bacterium RBG_13_60_28]|nr:MAG: cysteine--tRNA ligase [Deltaproteobacteria bacterium RBG_13_60_28]
MNGKARNILELIGHTPIVRLNRLNPNPKVEVYVKLEYFNPGGSVKDRPALAMVEAAEASGELTPDKIIIEATSGNTGIGLALVAAVKGYRLLLAMPESASLERRRILQALGAELLLTPAHLGTDGAIEEAYRLARENPDKYYLPDQFNNPDNPAAHQGTSREIWEQTAGKVTTVIVTMGTTGTLMGVYRGLKEFNPAIQVVGVEPYLGHALQGLKNMKESYKPGIFDKTRADEIVHVEDEEAFETARRLARQEGLFLGMSSGAAVAVALRKAREMESGLIVAIAPDGGERYLSTPLFTEKEAPTLQFYNTLARAKEAFEPRRPGEALIFTDGPALNAPISLGVARRLAVADLLQRYLRFRDFQVRQVVSLIDLDDRALAGAAAAGQDLAEFTGRFRKELFQDLASLGIQEGNLYPLASEHIEDMVQLTSRLLERGFAYEKLRSVYFDISRFKDYGRLSRVDLSKIRVGKTVDLDEYAKENPRDFTLFKRAKLAELKKGLYFSTPWGKVRPSWHLECAAMALKHLGESADFHVGGIESVFPHEENENALFSAATGKPLARAWLHCERVLQQDRPRKEEGPATVRDLLAQGALGRDVRHFLLATHYRKPLSFTAANLKAAARARARLDHFLERLTHVSGEGSPQSNLEERLFLLKKEFIAALDDDLNISRALSGLFALVGDLNADIDQGRLGHGDAAAILARLQELDEVLGVMTPPHPRRDADLEVLLHQREEARKRRDWAEADRIRKELADAGIEVIDTPTGPHWRRRG